MEQAYHAKQSVLKYESPRGNRERTAKERKTNQMAFGVLPPQTPKPCRSFLKKDHAASIGSRRVVGERELLPLRDCFNALRSDLFKAPPTLPALTHFANATAIAISA